MAIVFLICQYSGKTLVGIVLNVLYASLVYVLLSGLVPYEMLKYLQMTNVPIIVISRLIQVQGLGFRYLEKIFTAFQKYRWQAPNTRLVRLAPNTKCVDACPLDAFPVRRRIRRLQSVLVSRTLLRVLDSFDGR